MSTPQTDRVCLCDDGELSEVVLKHSSYAQVKTWLDINSSPVFISEGVGVPFYTCVKCGKQSYTASDFPKNPCPRQHGY